MDVINSVTTAILEYYPLTLTVLLGYYANSENLTGFWKPVDPPRTSCITYVYLYITM